MATTNFKLGQMSGRVVAEGHSANFTCELVSLKKNDYADTVAVVSFDSLKKQTAIVFPVDCLMVNPVGFCIDVCCFYEKFRADIWSDLYKG